MWSFGLQYSSCDRIERNGSQHPLNTSAICNVAFVEFTRGFHLPLHPTLAFAQSVGPPSVLTLSEYSCLVVGGFRSSRCCGERKGNKRGATVAANCDCKGGQIKLAKRLMKTVTTILDCDHPLFRPIHSARSCHASKNGVPS